MENIYFHADDYGRSELITENILRCLTQGNLNSVSVMVNHIDEKYHFKLKKLNHVNIRLHLNLTEISTKTLNKYPFLKELSFIKLLFLNKEKKKIIYEEIENQIITFKKIYNPKKFKIDGHEHVHMIPWIFRYLQKIKDKYNIQEIRNSNESLILNEIFDIFDFRFLRNLIACLVVKFLYYMNGSPKISDHKFIGIIYSGIQSEDTIIKSYNSQKKNNEKKIEILIHPGFTNINEKNFFKKKYYDFYSSKNRKKEYDLCFSKKIKENLVI